MTEAAVLRPPPPTEKEEQRRVVALFRAAGAVVHPTSQYRASHVAVGLPDLLCHHEGARAFWWFEVKRYEPRSFRLDDWTTWVPIALRPEQVEFRRLARACGQRHYVGGLLQAEAALVDLGLGTYRDGQFWLSTVRPCVSA